MVSKRKNPFLCEGGYCLFWNREDRIRAESHLIGSHMSCGFRWYGNELAAGHSIPMSLITQTRKIKRGYWGTCVHL